MRYINLHLPLPFHCTCTPPETCNESKCRANKWYTPWDEVDIIRTKCNIQDPWSMTRQSSYQVALYTTQYIINFVKTPLLSDICLIIWFDFQGWARDVEAREWEPLLPRLRRDDGFSRRDKTCVWEDTVTRCCYFTSCDWDVIVTLYWLQ